MEVKETKKKTVLRKGVKILLWTMGVWAVLIGIIQIAISDRSLSRIVDSFTEEYIDGDVSFGRISLSMFSHFPNASLNLENVAVTYPSGKFSDSEKCGFQARLAGQGKGEGTDTLATFDRFSVALNIPALITGRIKIPKAGLTKPRMFLHQYADGRSNWDILPGMGSEEEDTTSTGLPDIVLGETLLTGKPHIVFTDNRDTVSALLNLKEARLEGKIGTKKVFKNDFRMRVDSLIIAGRVSDDSLAFAVQQLDMKKSGQDLNFSTQATTALATAGMGRIMIPVNAGADIEILEDTVPAVNIRRLYMDAAGFPFEATGTARMYNGKINLDINGKTDAFDIGSFLKRYGKNLGSNAADITTDARLLMEAGIRGDYRTDGQGKLPEMSLKVTIPDSKLRHRKLGREILLDLDLEAAADSAGILSADLKSFKASGSGIALDFKGMADDLLGRDPVFKIDLNTSAVLDSLLWLLPESMDLVAEGNLQADIKGKIRMSQFNPYRLTESGLKGNIRSGIIRFQSDSLRTEGYLDSLDINLGSAAERDTTSTGKEKLMEITASIDSTYIIYQESLKANARKARLTLQNSTRLLAGQEGDAVHPVEGTFKAERLSLTDADSTTVIVRNTSNRFRIRPKKDSKNIPTLRFSSWTEHVVYRDSINRCRISSMGLDANAAMNTIEKKARFKAFRDSLQTVYPGTPADSLIFRWAREHYRKEEQPAWMQDQDFVNSDPDFRLSGKMAEYFRNWDINGMFNIEEVDAVTPLFPIRNNIDGFKGKFDNNTISLDRLALNSGASELDISGRLTGLRQALLRKGIITLDLDISSPQMDLNELMGAYYAGSRFLAEGSKANTGLEDSQYEEAVISDSLAYGEVPSTLIIPANLNANINLEANGICWSDLTIDWLSTAIIMKERCIQMKDFMASSNVGDISMDAFYSSTSKDDLKAGFDIDLLNITAGGVIDLVPAIDTLMPSLKSFDGMLNCEFAATTALDTSMNLIIPSTTGIIRIGGEDISIKDSPEFRQLAKTLMMKNKKEAHVESLKVEGLLNDSSLDIFPFKMNVDRYRLAMTGKQNMDMSFKYHLSVLKSPIPFRLGVEISGKDFDNMKIRLGKARYKNENLPSFSDLIDNMKANLVYSIKNVYEKGVNQVFVENKRQADKSMDRSGQIFINNVQSPDVKAFSPEQQQILKQNMR